jgi:putative component of toxin-antitoxin plasmid stabilization module
MAHEVEVITTEWYDAEFSSLEAVHRSRINRRIDLLQQTPWNVSLEKRMVAPLREGIYEMRVLGKGAAFRVLFFLAPGRTPRMVVLTACVAKSVMKKRRRFDAELARAETRRALWLERETKGRANGR